jgi:hypothetical protein
MVYRCFRHVQVNLQVGIGEFKGQSTDFCTEIHTGKPQSAFESVGVHSDLFPDGIVLDFSVQSSADIIGVFQ